MIISFTFPINFATMFADIKHLILFDDGFFDIFDFPLIVNARIFSDFFHFFSTNLAKFTSIAEHTSTENNNLPMWSFSLYILQKERKKIYGIERGQF